MRKKLFALAVVSITSVSSSVLAEEDPHANVTLPEPRDRTGRTLTMTEVDVIVLGNEFSVASGFIGPISPDPWPAQGEGTHFHSADGTPGVAATENDLEVGGLIAAEEVRGMVEFDLTGSDLDSGIASATTKCEVAMLGGLFGQGSSEFDIAFSSYVGNNNEDLADFGDPIPPVNTLATLSTSGVAVGDTISFDVTDTYLDLIDNVDPALGIRAQAVTDPGFGAITFNNCSLQIVLNEPPVAQCKDVTAQCAADQTANVSVDNGSFDPDGDPITLTQNTPPPYELFPPRMFDVKLSVTDDKGASDMCTGKVVIEDKKTPEVIAALVPSKENWLRVEFSCSDSCGSDVEIVAELEAGQETISVKNGQLVTFERDDESEIEWEGKILDIEAPSLKLTATCSDASGNVSEAVVEAPVKDNE